MDTVIHYYHADSGEYVGRFVGDDKAFKEFNKIGEFSKGNEPAELTEYELRTKWRDTAFLSRRDFCTACFRAGLLSAEDAVVAAKGDWPASFSAALDGLPTSALVEAQIEWATVTEIRRNAPLLEVVRATRNVTDEDLDEVFGWSRTAPLG